MSNNKRTGMGGIICECVLQALFLVLEFTNLIDWPWWLVMSPIINVIVISIGVTYLQRENRSYREYKIKRKQVE